MTESSNPVSPTTSFRRWLSARDTIAAAVESVCSDGNSDCFRVADDVINALRRQGFAIVGRADLECGLEYTA